MNAAVMIDVSELSSPYVNAARFARAAQLALKLPDTQVAVQIHSDQVTNQPVAVELFFPRGVDPTPAVDAIANLNLTQPQSQQAEFAAKLRTEIDERTFLAGLKTTIQNLQTRVAALEAKLGR